jgi:ribonuclease BN (tRNA processing enzyme)
MRWQSLIRHLLMASALFGCASTPSLLAHEEARSSFVVLGTGAGAIPTRDRSQPANVLLSGDQAILIDAGDGAAEQLAKAGISLRQIRSIFISHLHFDHTGGLFALLGLRYQMHTPGGLTIYGPPGASQMVHGLVAAMQPGADVGMGFPGEQRTPPETDLRIVELSGGDAVALGNIRVRAIANTHYSFAPETTEAARFQSLSFRFDLPDRSLV